MTDNITYIPPPPPLSVARGTKICICVYVYVGRQGEMKYGGTHTSPYND